MVDFTQIAINWLTIHWPAVLAMGGTGFGLSVFGEVLLHRFNVDSKKLAFFLINILSFGAALAAFMIDNVAVLGTYTGLLAIAQSVHRFFVSPYYNNTVLPYLEYRAQQKAQAMPSVAPVIEQPATTEPVQAFVG